MTGWSGVSTVLHDSSAGVHLMAADCPSASCYQSAQSTWGSDTAQQVQANINSALQSAGEPGTVTVSALSPIEYSLEQ